MKCNSVTCNLLFCVLLIMSGCNVATKNVPKPDTEHARIQLVEKLNKAAEKNNIHLRFAVYEQNTLLIKNPLNMQSKELDTFFKSVNENLKTVKKKGFTLIYIRSPEEELTISLYNIQE